MATENHHSRTSAPASALQMGCQCDYSPTGSCDFLSGGTHYQRGARSARLAVLLQLTPPVECTGTAAHGGLRKISTVRRRCCCRNPSDAGPCAPSSTDLPEPPAQSWRTRRIGAAGHPEPLTAAPTFPGWFGSPRRSAGTAWQPRCACPDHADSPPLGRA